MDYFMRGIFCLLVLTLPGCVESHPSDVTERPSDPADSDSLLLQKSMQSTPFVWAGLKVPKTFTVDEVDLPDHLQIVGITVGTVARAYAVKDLSHMTTHVVNDLLENSAVSVTYCNRTDVARVFSNSQSAKPIDLSIGGWKDNEMLIMLDGKFFQQEAKEVPLNDYPYQRTTWGEWKVLHPETTIYVANPTTVK
jgi:hypothetical protein